MSTVRSAPADGYDFGTKRQYRRDVWATFARFCGIHRAAAHALLMPSIEGDEIEVALSKGFRAEHLHVCDRNPAIVATLKRRFPKVQTYGVDIVRACERIVEAGVTLEVANLDLCGQVSDRYLRTLAAVSATGALDQAAVAVTALRGRERHWRCKLGVTAEALTEMSKGSKDFGVALLADQIGRYHQCDGQLGAMARTLMISVALSHRCWPVPPDFNGCKSFQALRYGAYRSVAGTQTMMFTIGAFGTGPRLRTLLPPSLNRELEREWRLGRLEMCYPSPDPPRPPHHSGALRPC